MQKAIYVLDTTLQNERNFQQCAELYFSLKGRDWEWGSRGITHAHEHCIVGKRNKIHGQSVVWEDHGAFVISTVIPNLE
jgi:hypothetical protein